jgi:hypothetical protein
MTSLVQAKKKQKQNKGVVNCCCVSFCKENTVNTARSNFLEVERGRKGLDGSVSGRTKERDSIR